MADRGAEFAGPAQVDTVSEDRDNGDKQERGLVHHWQQNRKFLRAQEEDAGLAYLRDLVVASRCWRPPMTTLGLDTKVNENTVERILDHFYWPTTDWDMQDYCRTCDVC
ncbi:UNVERIFIED_CONTAM: hypothetical protein K2H54_002904 [Gekko kuhli]